MVDMPVLSIDVFQFFVREFNELIVVDIYSICS